MKFLSLNIFLFGLLSITLAQAFPTDADGNLLVPVNLANRCQVKADVTSFIYENRDEITEEQILSDLQDDWDNVYSKKSYFAWHSFVDLQRIARDAYRTDANGEYIRDCCSEEVVYEKAATEWELCLHYTEY